MKKTILLLIAAVTAVNVMMAQTVADGIKLLNYEKNKSARDLFEKLYNANSKDPENIYWYGQSLIASNNEKQAKEVYQKALQDGINVPLLWVAMGQIDILETGDINSAKQKFEQAITATTETKGRHKGQPNAVILTAIGRANAMGGTKIGDANYGIEKLKQAATIDASDPNILIYEGICFLKLGGENGGDAVQAFTDAITRNPKNPLPYFRIGRVYYSQKNKEAFDKYFNATIQADSTFPPVYFKMFDYYANRDVNKAKEYLDKFLLYADKEPANDFYYADYLYRAGKYDESLQKAKELEQSAGIEAVPRLNVLYAYDYDKKGDSLTAKTYIEKYFATADSDDIVLTDYDLAISILTKIPGSELKAIDYINKAIDADSAINSKLNYINIAADIYAKEKDYANQLVWLEKVAVLKKDITSRDYYFICYAALKAKDTAKASKYSDVYIQKFPDQIYGYRFKTEAAIATVFDTTKGTAIPAIEQYIEFLKKDTLKNASILPYQFYYLASYYSDKAKELKKALETINRLLEIYPTDKFGLEVKPILEAEINRPAPKTAPKRTK